MPRGRSVGARAVAMSNCLVLGMLLVIYQTPLVVAGSAGAPLSLGPWSGGHHHPHAKRWMAEGRRSRLIHSMWGVRDEDGSRHWEPTAYRGGGGGGAREADDGDDNDPVIFPPGTKHASAGNDDVDVEKVVVGRKVQEAAGVAIDHGKEEEEGQAAAVAPKVESHQPPTEEQQQQQPPAVGEDAATGAPEHAGPAPLPLTDQDREVLELICSTDSWDRTLIAIANIPAIKNCPEFHMKITKAIRADSFLAATALGRLARQVKTEAEAEKIIGDRRFGQLLECLW